MEESQESDLRGRERYKTECRTEKHIVKSDRVYAHEVECARCVADLPRDIPKWCRAR
jgi:hypothetical protein